MSGSNSAERKRHEPLVLVETADDLHEDGVIHVVLAFGKGHHPAVSTVAGVGVDSGTYSMAGTGTFGCGQAFCR